MLLKCGVRVRSDELLCTDWRSHRLLTELRKANSPEEAAQVLQVCESVAMYKRGLRSLSVGSKHHAVYTYTEKGGVDLICYVRCPFRCPFQELYVVSESTLGADDEFSRSLVKDWAKELEKQCKYDEAENLQMMAAEKGDSEARFIVALMHLNGLDGLSRGQKQDFALACNWLQLAAAQGHGKATHYLAEMYRKGTGVEQDFARACELYRQAADRDVENAHYNLGYMYANGQGVARNIARAMELYRQAADRGDSNAMTALGRRLSTGKGLPQDVVRALHWYIYPNAPALRHCPSDGQCRRQAPLPGTV